MEFILLWHIISNTDIHTAGSHKRAVLVSSVHVTCFGLADHPLAFKTHYCKTQK